MADIVDRATRSRMMSGIGAIDTRPEMAVRSYLHRAGLRFRLHRPDLPGRPDIVLPRWRSVLFVHGCFWHRHPGCRFAYTPKSNVRFWHKKFEGNVARDRRNVAQLRAVGWRVHTIWGCQIKERALERLVRVIRRNGRS